MSFYENHSFGKELPIIFHLDRLEQPGHEKCISNWHENIELIYCIEGEGSAVINSVPAELKKGSLLLINSGEIHYIVSHTPKMKYYCLIIDTVFLNEFGIHVENISFSREVTDSYGRAFFEKIAGELDRQQSYYQAVVKGEILSYAAHLCRNYTSENSSHKENDRIKRGLTYIREHYTEDLTVDQIARHAGFSRYYFSRQFKNTTGMTVMKYVEFLRCRHARELLAGGASVSKAAVECGFSDVSYFTKVFKHQYGMLPSKIKRFVIMFLLCTCGMFMQFSAPKVNAAEAERAEITMEDFLKADGKNLRNQMGNGEVVNLRGTNAGGYLLQECWLTPTSETDEVRAESDIYRVLEERFGQETMYELLDVYQDSYWTEADFAKIADLGANCIRLPFWYRNLVDEKGEFYVNAFERIDDFLEDAGECGLYVILDFHGAPGSQSGSDHSGVDGRDDKEKATEFFFGENAEENHELYYKIWEEIAARYAGNPVVAGYDLLNEPYCTYRYSSTYLEEELHSLLWETYDEAYERIRAVDADHIIIMEAVWDPWDLPDPAKYGWENIMYEYHNYLYDDYDNAGGRQITSMEDKLLNIAKYNYDVPCYLGEFSYFNNLEAWKEGLELLTEYGVNWTTWTYKCVSEYGNWGLYHHPEELGEVDITTASYEEIKEFWGRMDECKINSGLAEVVSKYCNYETQEYNLSLWKLYLRRIISFFR